MIKNNEHDWLKNTSCCTTTNNKIPNLDETAFADTGASIHCENMNASIQRNNKQSHSGINSKWRNNNFDPWGEIAVRSSRRHRQQNYFCSKIWVQQFGKYRTILQHMCQENFDNKKVTILEPNEEIKVEGKLSPRDCTIFAQACGESQSQKMRKIKQNLWTQQHRKCCEKCNRNICE